MRRRTGGAGVTSSAYSVAVSGSTTVAGAPCHNPGTGAAHVLTRSGTAWSQHAELTTADGATSGFFGDSAAISGSTAVVGTYLHNSAPEVEYVFVNV